jgi:hypothetical protein
MPGTFPTLSTGAIAQYPLTRELHLDAEVVRFLDGCAQAYRNQAVARRRWVIDLALLNATEVTTLREFFEEQKGAWGTFRFTDPWTGSTFASCSFDDDAFPEQQEAEGRNAIRLVIRA